MYEGCQRIRLRNKPCLSKCSTRPKQRLQTEHLKGFSGERFKLSMSRWSVGRHNIDELSTVSVEWTLKRCVLPLVSGREKSQVSYLEIAGRDSVN